MSSDKEGQVASRSGPLELDIGPPLSSRQRKAAAAFTLAQLLALADLRATVRLKELPGCRSRSVGARTNGVLASCRSAATRAAAGGPMAVLRLRQSAAKRRAEAEADAALGTSQPQHHRTGFRAAAPTAVVGKRIAIVPPLSTPQKNAVQMGQLGCHLARRCGRGTGGIGPSSLARVYGSRLRVGQLPDDYAECFIGLEPVRQPADADPNEKDSSADPAARRTAISVAVAGTMDGSGLAPPPPTAGAFLGSVGVASEEISFLFAANAGMTSPLGTAPALAPGVPVMGAAVGSLMAPYAPLAANYSQPAPGLLYTAPSYGTHPGSGPDARGMFRGAEVAPAVTAAAPDLMLDADDSGGSSEDDDDDDDDGGGTGGIGQDMGTDAALGAAFDDEFEDADPLTQRSSGGMGGYLSGFGGTQGGGMFPYVTGGGGTAVFGTTVVGLGGVGGGGGGGSSSGGGMFGTETGPSPVDDDGVMVEEF
ncbi:hypothetical protein Vafri_9311 [Volvox africanus]|uniref:Uncharacterized protein n=1 Tax=Volvox africanus TaxID=51714 RepID=A0A8J4EZT7_9CHLO|nr:hypothetical protein Vafri_9311 [Volvox africanus]